MGMQDRFIVKSRLTVYTTDLSTMEDKLENNHYGGIDDFLADAKLIFDNCRKYNGDKNTYSQQANKLEKALERIMKKRQQDVVTE
jgi:histone acetyltransferase